MVIGLQENCLALVGLIWHREPSIVTYISVVSFDCKCALTSPDAERFAVSQWPLPPRLQWQQEETASQ